MASEDETKGTGSSGNANLHIFFFPFKGLGHMIPMIDLAKLFSTRGVKSTLLVTSHDVPLVLKSIESTQKHGFDISILTMEEVGLPEHCKGPQSFTSEEMFDKQLEKLIEEHRPNCLISDMFFPWTTEVALKANIPRLSFYGTSHFAIGAEECMIIHKPHLNVASNSEPFLISNFPGDIVITKDQLPDFIKAETDFTKLFREVFESELISYGTVMNSFYELEPSYADHYCDVLGRRSWRIGPLSLCNQEIEDKLGRGNRERNGKGDSLNWLDSKDTDSVVYICFGSKATFSASQLHEIALGLQASGQQFVWVVQKDENVEEGKEEWLPEGYEERMKEKGLIIRGWAPQILILEHRAVCGFVTHCGWNSVLEGISAGVAMVTWPGAADQFFNEKLVTQVLMIGVPVGVKKWARRPSETLGSEQVEKAVRRVMVGDEADEMTIKARELSKKANKAVEEGGSSHNDLTALIEELKSLKLAGNK